MSFPKNLLMKNPAGSYSYVGRVSVKLAWVNKNGSLLSDSEAERISRASNPAMFGRVRVFKTVQEAKQAAIDLNVEYDLDKVEGLI